LTEWRDWPSRDPERQAAYYKEWIERPGNRDKVNAQGRKNRRKYLLRDFGISQEQYDEMLRRQKGVCALCHKPETATRSGRIRELCLDHCHATGKPRAFLCSNCNTLLGRVRDDIGRLHQLIDYIEKHRSS
jgi:hypothetical protein